MNLKKINHLPLQYDSNSGMWLGDLFWELPEVISICEKWIFSDIILYRALLKREV